jgi:hypothetical protein
MQGAIPCHLTSIRSVAMARYRVQATLHITATVEYEIVDSEPEPVEDPEDDERWALAEETGQQIVETVSDVVIEDSRVRLVNIDHVTCSVSSIE